MGNGEIVSVPDGEYRVEGCSRSTGPYTACLQLDVEGRRGLTPLAVDENIAVGATVTVEDNEVVAVEEPEE